MKHGLLAFVFAGISLCTIGCAATLPQHSIPSAATYKAKVDIRFRGFKRTYRVHVPPGYHPDRPLPLVVVVHGGFDDAKGMEKFSRFSLLADEENFIAVYPNGISLFGFLEHWNAGHCCAKAAADKIDDVGYLTAVIEDTIQHLSVDRDRIYMTGFSNGGMMVHRFAAERTAMLAAIAPLAATIGGRPDEHTPEWSPPPPSKALPVLTIHGLEDFNVPIAGGISPIKRGSREYWSLQRTLDFWIKNNGCDSEPERWEKNQGSVQVTRWHNCRNHAEVVRYLLKGWGHVWPGTYFTADLDENDPLHNFDATHIIWNFFKHHRR